MSSVQNVPERKYALAGVSTSICPARGITAEVITYPGGGGDEIHA
jgi:hypothetical protein